MNHLGTLSLAMAVLGLMFGPLGSVPAIILGRTARSAVLDGVADNKRVALAGWLLGWIVTSIWVVALLVALAFVLSAIASGDDSVCSAC